MNRVFMDGGSGINIIFADILHGMNILTTNLAPSVNTFHGIVPGRPVLGTITLEVIFGEPTNFRKEKIEFEVVDWKSTTPSLGDPRTPSSWRSRTTPTSS